MGSVYCKNVFGGISRNLFKKFLGRNFISYKLLKSMWNLIASSKYLQTFEEQQVSIFV
jgi:hypothetical protein